MAKKTNGARPGPLMAIGGAEDKLQEKFILQTFHRFSGGRLARIAILPTASRERDTGAAYHSIFSEFGVRSVENLPVFRSRDANDPAVARLLENATGIFLTGGDQNKILSVLAGTEAFTAIHRAYAAGAVVAGTSAGASALSDPMIAGGLRGSLPLSGMVKIARGLGLATQFIIDQHFHQRERLGRLMHAVMLYPNMTGVGVDEDTAAIVHPGGWIDAIGRGTVTIVSGAGLAMFEPLNVPDMSPLAFSNMMLHTLTRGCRYSIKTRSLVLDRRASQEAAP